MLRYCFNCGYGVDFGNDYCDKCKPLYKEVAQPHALEAQCGGDHYSKLGEYQPWAVLSKWLTPEELRGFMKGTVISYLAREKDKGKDLDIKKALHTMQLFEELRTDAKDAGQLD